jgi:hypothetical protein
MLAVACGLLLMSSARAAVSVIAGSVVNGTVVDPDKATDGDYMTFMEINGTGVSGERVSFDVDLGADTIVRDVAMYGLYYYNPQVMMLSDEIRVEAATSSGGPWTQIGSINVGNTRPTDPNPAIGGVNPWTGGNGRRIPCTPTNARYLRISGDQGFDNVIRVAHLQINPKIVLQQISPIYEQVAFHPFDPGGGNDNTRIGVDLFDGKLNTRTFLGTTVSLTLDLGSALNVAEFRLLTSESDSYANAETGSVRISSTDDPANFDVLETNFDTHQPRISGQYGVGQVPLPNRPTKRYYQLNLLTNRDNQIPNGTAGTLRIGEIEYRTADQVPLKGAAVVAGSIVGGSTPGGSEGEAGAFDPNYQTYFQIDQGADPTGSFVISLGGSREVHSVAFYGVYSYLDFQMMFSDDVTVEAANSATGPWTQIGSINVGNTRPTDPNPTIGGPNPWTGGNGRIVPCTSTVATHLRVSFGYAFDNHLRLYHAIVNAPFVIQEISPIDQGSTLPVWDAGGGDYNSRVGVDMADGSLQTCVNPQRPFAATFDLGKVKRIAKVRLYAYESDADLLPTQGVVRTSSTDDPTNMNTTVIAFNQTYIGGGVTEIVLPATVEKRYLQLDLTQSGKRWAEVEMIEADPLLAAAPSAAANWTLY